MESTFDSGQSQGKTLYHSKINLTDWIKAHLPSLAPHFASRRIAPPGFRSQESPMLDTVSLHDGVRGHLPPCDYRGWVTFDAVQFGRKPSLRLFRPRTGVSQSNARSEDQGGSRKAEGR